MVYLPTVPTQTCSCCSLGLVFLAEAFFMPRRLFHLGTGALAAALALGGKKETKASPPPTENPSS